MKLRIITISLFTLLQLTLAQEANYLFQRGNTHYQNGEYEQAIEDYEAVLKQGYESAELYYNLGNAYYKTNQLGKSILNFERARELAPKDPDIQYNLEIARLRVVDKIPEPPPYFLLSVWNTAKNTLTLHQLSVIAIALWIVFVTIVILKWLVRRKFVAQLARITFMPVLVLLIIFTFLFAVCFHEDATTQQAIVIVDKVDVTSSPSKNAKQVFSLHEGVKVNITEQSSDYYRIQLRDGKIGWLRQNTVDII